MDGLPIIEETPTEQEVGSKKLEQLLMNLLSERDKLAQKYKESQDELKVVSDRLRDTQSDKVVLVHQLRTLVPEVSLLSRVSTQGGDVVLRDALME
jgi:Tfp pilus assembly protein PilN